MIGLILLGLFTLGCENAMQPVHEEDPLEKEVTALEKTPCPLAPHELPSPLVTVSVGAASLELWPYTGTNFSGTPQDPVNLIFFGKADPRDIRAALLSLNGDRTAFGFPPVPPFNLTWDDGMGGDEHTGYGGPDGWTGSAIQLACGAYDQPRFHIRLFKAGPWTIASAHFEVLIPGTTDHQVLSWELAEQFVTADFTRSGLLNPGAPVIPTGKINESPFRTIPAIIYNGLPVELRALIGGPLGNVTEDVGIPTDGHAVILNLAGKAARVPGVRSQDFIINFDQVVPKPFCSSGPTDYIFVQGPVRMQQTVRLTPGGVYTMSFYAQAKLTATPVDPVSGQPIGATMNAFVTQRHAGTMTDRHWHVSGMLFQKLGDFNQEGSGVLFTRLQTSSRDVNSYEAKIRCGSDSWRPVAKPAGLLETRTTGDQTDHEYQRGIA